MASVIIEELLDCPAEKAWALLRNVGAAAEAFPGVLLSSTLDGTVRTVRFANGTVAQEQIVTVDDDRMRMAYAVKGGRFTHHSASMQIVRQDARRCLFIWLSDFLPDEAAPIVRGLVVQGTAAFKRTAEAG